MCLLIGSLVSRCSNPDFPRCEAWVETMVKKEDKALSKWISGCNSQLMISSHNAQLDCYLIGIHSVGAIECLLLK